LEITLRSNLVEKLSLALYDCLFELEEYAGGFYGFGGVYLRFMGFMGLVGFIGG
jgi:hypothetical protein